MSSNLQLYLALNRLHGLQACDIEYLSQYDGDLASLLSSSHAVLKRAGFADKSIEQLKLLDWHLVEDELKWAEAADHHIITLDDTTYPEILRKINAPPIVLFVYGQLDCLRTIQLAMVGSRNPTSVGREVAFEFAKYLAESGLAITSGLAIGIDSASHEGALAAGGATIAVMGTGIDYIYPVRNRALAEQIVECGALITEFPLYTPVKRENFPQRNRIISGLSIGTLVVEAALRSGSLITARLAGEQGREVFAIPGSIHNPLARGCHKLLHDGAKLVEKAGDILEELKLCANVNDTASVKFADISIAPQDAKFVTKAEVKNRILKCDGYISRQAAKGSQELLDVDRRKLLSSIGFEMTTIDTLVVRTGFVPAEIASMLLMLELAGYVRQVPGGYERVRYE